MEIFTYISLALFPGIAGLLSLIGGVKGAKIQTASIWIVFILFCSLIPAETRPIDGWGFQIGRLSLALSLLVLLISGVIHIFSIRYMSGDRKFNYFFLKLSLLTSSLLLMIGSDNLLLMLAFWIGSNLLLATLMVHKREWPSARNSGILIRKFTLLGGGFFALAISILAYDSGTFSLSTILDRVLLIPYPMKFQVLLLLIATAVVQSGCWPFHKWLISSLNSPTPVSGLMHAGLVNGGGFLLARFAPLFSDGDPSLHILFTLGLVSVILGTLWKLIQSNIKGMLACSTMAQMGFMLMQCGLGLFAPAMAHLCLHGLFKSYLFLNSGSAIQEHRESTSGKRFVKYVAALVLAIPGVYAFGSLIGFSFGNWTTKTVLIVFSWLANAEIAYLFLGKTVLCNRVLLACLGPLVFGLLYGYTILLFESFLHPLAIIPYGPLHPIHVTALCLVGLISFSVNTNLFSLFSSKRLYVEMLNMSQSHETTVTSIRNAYKNF